MRPLTLATLVIASALGLPGANAAPVSTRVTVQSGTVDGAIEGDIAAWRGIPYAAAPTGAYRWQPPRPIYWPAVRQARVFGSDCMQNEARTGPEATGIAPSEDCLFLNVWRPAAATHAKLPVLVWIHGGAFVVGAASNPLNTGTAFARDGVVFVSFNYRLGRFGFFAHPALGDGQPGNYAYMDQLAALHWVQQNIVRFGGDPANVTVFGESAGGAMVLGLLASPAAKGLFARVVVSSGGGRDGFRLPPAMPLAEQIGVNFARHEGITGTGQAALAALRALPAEHILDGLDMGSLDSSSTGPDATFTRGPITDGTIVTGTIGAMLAKGTSNRVPLLIGSNSADGCCATGTTMAEYFAPFGPRAAAAQAAYQSYVDRADHDRPSIGNAVARDFNQSEPARYFAGAASTLGTKSYVYHFDYVAQAKRGTWPGAPHGSDLPYFFDTLVPAFGDGVTDGDKAMARMMHGYLVNFVRTGNPEGPGLAPWAPALSGDGKVMRFGFDGQAHYGDDPWKPLLDLVQASR